METETNPFEYYINQYKVMHSRAKMFAGYSLKFHVSAIRDLILRTSSETLLDYGCGKGLQYLGRRFHDKWGGILPYCYDPAVPGLDVKPDCKFDGVICTDVLEHIPTENIRDVVEELFKYSKKFVYACVSVTPSNKHLPDGTNCHIAVHSREWWTELFDSIAGPRKLYMLAFREDQTVSADDVGGTDGST